MILFFWISSLFAQKPLERLLPPELFEKLCAGVELTPKILWEFKIFDGDVRSFEVTGATYPVLPIIIKQMKSSGHHGYGEHKCSETRTVFITTPSDYAFLDYKNSKSCARFRQLLVNLKGGQSVKKTDSADFFESIYCDRKLFFIVPHGKAITFFEDKITEVSFFDWLQKIRMNNHLKPLVLNSKLGEIAMQLSVSEALSHNFNEMKKVTKANKSLQLIGENRVLGKSWQDHAQLFWISASHRDLLLDPDAQSFGFHDLILGQETLKVVVTAKL